MVSESQSIAISLAILVVLAVVSWFRRERLMAQRGWAVLPGPHRGI